MQFLHESFNYILVLKTVDIDSSKNTEPEPDKVDYWDNKLDAKANLEFACEK